MSTTNASPTASKRPAQEAVESPSKRPRLSDANPMDELQGAAKQFQISLDDLLMNNIECNTDMFYSMIGLIEGGHVAPIGLQMLEDEVKLKDPSSLSEDTWVTADDLLQAADACRRLVAERYRAVLALVPDDSPRESIASEDPLQCRLKALQDAADAASPRRAARSLKQEQKEHPMHLGYPLDKVGPPIFLYHEIFARFQAYVRDPPTAPSPQDVFHVINLMKGTCNLLDSEEKLFIGVFSKLLGRSLTLVQGSPQQPGAIYVYAKGSIGIPLLILELNTQLSGDFASPYLRGALRYRKLWAHELLEPIRNISSCPAFILSVAGPHIAVHGGIFTDEFIVQPLTDTLSLANDPDLSSRANYIASRFIALRRCLSELESYYVGLFPSEQLHLNSISPTFNHFIANGKKIPLSYLSLNLLHDRTGRALFDADANYPGMGDISVKVKFTPSYCEEAHNLLARQGLAPVLRYCGTVDCGWKVVVMDVVAGPNMRDVEKENGPIPPRAIRDVENAIFKLHEAEWVFGDLRPPNIMLCDRDDEPQSGAVLIDFDWTGKHGQARYPATLNTTLKWAQGVEPAGIMMKEHDLGMLELLPRPERT